jgi:hypothetical protein
MPRRRWPGALPCPGAKGGWWAAMVLKGEFFQRSNVNNPNIYIIVLQRSAGMCATEGDSWT